MPETIPAVVSDGERRLLAVWRWISGAGLGWAGTFLLTTGAVLLAFGTDHKWLFRTGIVVTAVGLVWQITAGPRLHNIMTAERESRQRALHRSATLRSILEAGVLALMNELKVDFNEARVSVYRHKDDHFILLSRQSLSPVLKSRGRGRYPDTEGLIGRAWEKGEGVVVDLPENRDAWERMCVAEYDMEPKSVSGIAMQSKSLVGKRFDSDVRPKSPVGLIVIESTKKRGVNGTTLDELRSSPVYPLLEQVLIEAVACLDEQDVDDFNDSR